MSGSSLFLAASLACALAQDAAAQAADSARMLVDTNPPDVGVGPPVRRIATASALSTEPLGAIFSVRELPDGRVLVNDGVSRRLLLMDTMLVTERVVLDSLSELENTYGNSRGALLAHRGDSSFFIDPTSLALLVIDPSGTIVRVRSVPRAEDTYSYASPTGSYGPPGIDARGRIVYRVWARPAPPARAPPRGVPYFPTSPDSAFVVALDIDSRQLDTLGAVRIPKSDVSVRLRPGGGFSFVNSINPMPMMDAWAVLADGSVAFVRGIDYRVEYRHPDGTWTSSPKIPFDWQPISDDEKQRIVDSVRTSLSVSAQNAYVTSLIRWVNTYRRKYPPNFTAHEGYAPPNGFAKEWQFPPGVTFPDKYIHACAPGVEPTVTPAVAPDAAPVAGGERVAAVAELMAMAGMPGPPPRGTPSCIPQPIPNLARVPDPPRPREVSVISPTALPDFRPPFGENAARADMDGNLWIRTNPTKPVRGGPVFDIVSRDGQLVDRLQLPPGYTLVGFGRGRVLFLSMRDAQGIHLARVRLK